MAKNPISIKTGCVRYHGVVAVAKTLGRDPSHISRVLSGKRKPSAALAKELKRLGVTLPQTEN